MCKFTLPKRNINPNGVTHFPDGSEEWRLDGKTHRIDGPAITDRNRTEIWYLNGVRHRDNGPAVTRPDGSEEWFRHGYRHRVGGPAVTCKGRATEWYQDGVHHRLDGPAIEYPDGTFSWWVEGENRSYFEVEPNVIVVCSSDVDLSNLPDIEKIAHNKYRINDLVMFTLANGDGIID